MANPAVGTIDFYSEQGTTFRRRVLYGYSTLPADQVTGPADVDGYYAFTDVTAKMYVRTWDRTTIVQQLTTENGGITLGAEPGAIDLYVSDEDTDLWDQKKYRYDLELEYANGDTVKKFRGTIFNEVTNTRDDG